MKDVAVISVHQAALTRPADESRRRQPTVHEARHATYGAGFRSVCVHEVRLFAQHQTKEFPDRQRILRRDLTAHVRQNERRDAGLFRDVTHVVLARGQDTRNEQRIVAVRLQAGRQPNNMTCGTANVQTRNDAEDFHHKLLGGCEGTGRLKKIEIRSLTNVIIYR